jgi:hypothetical protein
VGVRQAGSKNAKGKERSVQRAQKNERRTVKRKKLLPLRIHQT